MGRRQRRNEQATGLSGFIFRQSGEKARVEPSVANGWEGGEIKERKDPKRPAHVTRALGLWDSRLLVDCHGHFYGGEEEEPDGRANVVP